MSEQQSWNDRIMAEFRANDGRVGGPFEGASMVLIHHVGARSGTERVTPLVYQDLGGDSIAVFASNNGGDQHPAWYHNLLAHPRSTAEIGTTGGIESREVAARVADSAERTEIWERQKAARPAFADYERGTDREIPVVVLDPV